MDQHEKFYIIASTVTSLLLLLAFCVTSCQAEIKEETAVRCIIGEAANQGYRGMLALASGLRNRGTTKGVYGCKAKFVDSEPQWVWSQARKAWRESYINRVHDGTHWENIQEFGTPWWAKNMVKVYWYQDHVFYKERGK